MDKSYNPGEIVAQHRKKLDELVQKTMNDPEVQFFIKTQASDLTPEEITRSQTKLFEFIRQRDKFNNNDFENQFFPGFKPTLIMNHRYIDVRYEPTDEMLMNLKNEKIKDRIQTMNIPIEARNAKLKDVQNTPERMEVFIKITEFIKEYVNERKYHKGLFLYGGFGVGKTFILGALANELASKGIHSIMFHFPTFAEEMKQAIGQKDSHRTIENKIDAIKKVDVLMIDDIGAESNSEWIRDSVLGVILQYRMQEQKPTFFTSNQDFAHLEKHLENSSKGNIEPLKAKRIMERVKYLSEEVRMDGENKRNQF